MNLDETCAEVEKFRVLESATLMAPLTMMTLQFDCTPFHPLQN